MLQDCDIHNIRNITQHRQCKTCTKEKDKHQLSSYFQIIYLCVKALMKHPIAGERK